MSVRENVIKWVKANKMAAGIIAYLAVSFIVGIFAIIIVFALPDSKPSTTSTEAPRADTVAEQPTETQPAQETPAETTTEQPAPVEDDSAAKELADSVVITSTGRGVYDKYGYDWAYGFILEGKKDIAKSFTVSITIKNDINKNGLNYPDFFKKDALTTGYISAGTIPGDADYTRYSYKVTVDGKEFSYPDAQILY